MSMSTSRPAGYPRPEPEPESLFNVTVAFNDGEPSMSLADVTESEVVNMYQHLGVAEARMRLQPRPGFHYFTAASRIQHITATLIEEASN